MDEIVKRTSLYEKHINAKAKMIAFAGFEMPVHYTDQIEEHKAVREQVGLFDVSHMGQLEIKGKDALAAVNRLVTNDVRAIENGQAMYAPIPNEKGGIVDDTVVYRMSDTHVFVCINAANRAKDYQWFKSHIKGDVTLENNSDFYAQLAIQGPYAEKTLQPLTPVDLSKIGTYKFAIGTMVGVPNCIISRTGYTGEDGFEVYLPTEKGPVLWDAVMGSGKDYGIMPIGLGARDTLRLEMKYPLYGNDITDETSPLEAGLRWAVKFKKQEPFTAIDILTKEKDAGSKIKLIGFKMLERGIPRHGYKVFTKSGEGIVTSGTMSPSLGEPIGIAYVPSASSEVDTEIEVEIRNRKVKAKIVKTPFYQKTK